MFELAPISFDNPEALALIPLVLAVLYFRRHDSPALSIASSQISKGVTRSFRQRVRRPVLSALTILFFLALGIGAAKPYSGKVIELPTNARNILLAIDISRSMATADFKSERGILPRFEAVRAVVSGFISERAGDRIGLVVFGSSAFVQSPLTTDHTILQDLISRLSVGLAGDGTAIGDGLGLAIKRLADVPAKSAAIVLLTDGVNNSGLTSPEESSAIAEKIGIRVHTIGIGSNEMQVDPFGVPVGADFDEKTLKEIAVKTGAEYFHAKDLNELRRVYNKIDQLEKTDSEPPLRELKIDYSYILAYLALATFLILVVLKSTLFLRVPE